MKLLPRRLPAACVLCAFALVLVALASGCVFVKS
jgi:hypothetical protein